MLYSKKLLKMNLQTFAEGDDPAGAGAEGAKELTPEQIEINKKIEAESDRKLASAKLKWEQTKQAEIDQAIKDAKEKAESYGALTEKQRLDKEAEEERTAFLKEKEEFQKERLTLDIQSDLSVKGLPIEFAEVLSLLGDKEVISAKVTEIKTKFDEAVNNAVKEGLRQKTPNIGGSTKDTKVNSFAAAKNEAKKTKNVGPNPWGK